MYPTHTYRHICSYFFVFVCLRAIRIIHRKGTWHNCVTACALYTFYKLLYVHVYKLIRRWLRNAFTSTGGTFPNILCKSLRINQKMSNVHYVVYYIGTFPMYFIKLNYFQHQSIPLPYMLLYMAWTYNLYPLRQAREVFTSCEIMPCKMCQRSTN